MTEFFNSLDVNIILKYSIALAIILGTHLLCPIIIRIIIYIFHKLFKIKTKTSKSGFYGPLKFIFTVIGFGIAIYFLNLPDSILSLYNKIFRIFVIMALAKALTNCLNPNSSFFTKLEESTKFNGNEALNSFISKILKAVIYIVAGYMILTDLNYDLGGLATGLGIGSAVIALAAQDFVKSLIGGFTIITDKPFEIGDYIEVGEFQGTVIDITFRSTRIKAVNNTIIAIPNSVIITEYVKNWSKLENRRIELRLRISLNSPTETINRVVTKLSIVLKSNKNVIDNTVSVFLEGIEDDANVIWIALHVNTSDYNEYLKIKQEINCDILEVLEKENIELVYPTQKVYMKTI